MTFLEILLAVICCILPFSISIKASRSNNFYIIGLMILAASLHVIIDGIRWQMSPIYFLLVIVMFSLALKWSFFKGGFSRKAFSFVFWLLLMVTGVGLSSILPVFALPITTGPYDVGVDYIHFITAEDEPLSADSTDSRELMIKVWYPAKIKDETKEKYLTVADRQGFAMKYGLPAATFDYLDYIETNTYVRPTIAEGKFPVLIFSHGQYSQANAYYSILQEIASAGFFVLAINHTYESVGSVFPTGEIKFYNQEYDNKHNGGEMAEMAWQTMEAFKTAKTLEEKTKLLEGPLKNYYAAEITRRWSKDIGLVAAEIHNWKANPLLRNRIDTESIGVFGHSQGGSAATQAISENPSITAGINIDGAQWGDVIDTLISRPFLLLSSDWPDDHPDFNEVVFQNGTAADFYKAKITGSGHPSFMDIPYMINLKQINEAGTIDKVRASAISADLVIGFFERYLKGKEVDLEQLSEKYPELLIEKVN
jgi:predicted dienelactone hydrolase